MAPRFKDEVHKGHINVYKLDSPSHSFLDVSAIKQSHIYGMAVFSQKETQADPEDPIEQVFFKLRNKLSFGNINECYTLKQAVHLYPNTLNPCTEYTS